MNYISDVLFWISTGMILWMMFMTDSASKTLCHCTFSTFRILPRNGRRYEKNNCNGL